MFSLFLALFCWLGVAQANPVVHRIDVNGGIDPGMADYIITSLDKAQAAQVDAVVIQLDTPGGLISSSRDIVSAELNSTVPVIVWVGPAGARAGSAGVFITLAGNIAAMAPGTNIGAAHPVSLGGGGLGGDGEDEDEDGSEEGEEGEEGKKSGGNKSSGDNVMGEKILNDTLAWVRSIAEERGKNVDWAEDSVKHSASITSSEALALNVIDLEARTMEELLEAVHGREVRTSSGTMVLNTAGATVEVSVMSVQQSIVHFLGDPNVLYVLMGLGALGVWIEFKSPGLIVPAVIGVLCLIAAGIGLSVLPFNVGGLLLVIGGFGAVAAEVYVGGAGLFALSGGVALVVGGLLLFDVEGFDLRVDWGTLMGVSGAVVGFGLLAAYLVARAHTRKVPTGEEGLIGSQAKVTRGGEGGGQVQVMGELWSARWTGTLTEGAAVRITKVDGLTLDVEPEKA